jgi:hypothetical protein
VEIPGVPETFPREKVVAFFKDIGIDPSWCTSLELKANGVYAEIFVRHEGNTKFVTNNGEPAIHKVFVKFD